MKKHFLAHGRQRTGDSARETEDKPVFYPLSVVRCTLKGVLILSLIFPLCGFKFLSELQNEKANALYKKGQIGKAKTEYLRALKTDPSSPKISYNLGNALFREGAFKESQETYQKAAITPAGGGSSLTGWRAGASGGKEPEPLFQAKAFYNLGNSQYRQKDLPGAAEAYKKSLRLNPNDQDAKYNLELVLKQLEKEKKNDQKKDDPKKDDRKKDDQKKDQNQGGGGSQGSEGQKENDSNGDGGEKQDKQGSGEQSSGDQDKSDEEKEQPGRENKQAGARSAEPGTGEESDIPPASDLPAPGSAAQSPKEEQAQPKSEAERRAEQLLGALENQEQQVLKFQNSQNGPRGRVRRVTEQDW